MKTDILTQLGLTEREAEVYTTLLKLGEVPIAKLLKSTGAHPQVVYRAIDGLIAKQLVLVAQKQHRKYVKAESPRVLEQLEKERLEQLQASLPALLALQADTTESIVRVHKGVEALRRLRWSFIDDIPTGGTLRIIGGSGNSFFKVLGNEFFAKTERARVKKQIQRLVVTYRSQAEGMKEQDPAPVLSEYRYFKEHFPVPASILIGHTFVAIYIWAKHDPVAIQIEQPELVQTYTDHFQMLWGIAKP